MIDLGTARRNFGSMEDALGELTRVGGQELVSLLATQEALAALTREHEHAIEAEDVLSQADEALVMG